MNTPPLMWAILATIAIAVIWYTFIDPYFRFRKTVAANTARNLEFAAEQRARVDAMWQSLAVNEEAVNRAFDKAFKELDFLLRLDAKKAQIARRKSRTHRLGGI